MSGKEKCRVLREIRMKIAEENGIDYRPAQCRHEGPCAGTCPKCEQEKAQLEKELSRRAALGKKVALAGLCAGLVLATSGCSMIEELFESQVTGIMPAQQVDLADGRTGDSVPTDTVDVLVMGEVPAPEDT